MPVHRPAFRILTLAWALNSDSSAIDCVPHIFDLLFASRSTSPFLRLGSFSFLPFCRALFALVASGCCFQWWLLASSNVRVKRLIFFFFFSFLWLKLGRFLVRDCWALVLGFLLVSSFLLLFDCFLYTPLLTWFAPQSRQGLYPNIPYLYPSPPHEMGAPPDGALEESLQCARQSLSPVHTLSRKKLLVVVNSSGRQASSVIRCASAVGYKVRGQLRRIKKNAQLSAELQALPDVELVEGSLEDEEFVQTLFEGADLAFINTTPYGWTDEVVTGKRLVDAAKQAGVGFYVYSGLTDHSKHPDRPLSPLPLWSTKFTVEEYIRETGIPAAFPYVGCYHNNFSSRPYPLWQLTPLADGSFEWRTPFPEDVGIPFIDTEHDLGAAVIQILKDGPRKWHGKRVALAFEVLTPPQACELFSLGLQRPVRYVNSPCEIKIPIPDGYRDQLLGIVDTLCENKGEYFSPDMECPETARRLWPGWRGLEEYAREVWPLEEKQNGAAWAEGLSGTVTPAEELEQGLEFAA